MTRSDGSIDVYLAVNEANRRIQSTNRAEDTYLLRLDDQS
jgi:hypothetical protein